MIYDAIITGASFAGLAAARELDGNVLVIDSANIGKGQTSACGMPYKLVKELGCRKSVLQVFDTISIQTPKVKTEIKSKEPYCTIDYEKFCKLLGRKKNFRFLKATVTGMKNNKVLTSQGDFRGRIFVDCSGWNAVLASSLKNNFVDRNRLSFGIETVVDYEEDELVFFIDKNIIEQGACWLFPAGKKARLGVASYAGKTEIMPNLKKFMSKFGLKINRKNIHGGYIPHGLREPTIENVFLAGDSAGQVLPLTAEGIRKAIISGQKCGTIIRKITDKKLTLKEGLKEYRNYALKNERKYSLLLKAQSMMADSPEFYINTVLRLLKNRRLSRSLEKRYLKL